jgi:hypothetical protein
MKTLNERYEYGLNLFLHSINEGITGYRDDSLEVSNKRALPFLWTPRLSPMTLLDRQT